MLLIREWFRSSHYRQGLDVLLVRSPAGTAPLRVRLDWLGSLVNWVRTVGPKAFELGNQKGRVQVARLKLVLQVLERNPDLKKKVSESLRSIIRDTKALELFINAGVPNQLGFIGELGERLNLRFLPQAPRDQDLVAVFSETFRFESDAEWILNIHPEHFQAWLDLFQDTSGESQEWNTLIKDAKDALFLLSRTVQTIGLSRLVRNRVAEPDFRNLPFFGLPAVTEKFLGEIPSGNEVDRGLAFQAMKSTLDQCSITVDEIYSHFRSHGVSISLVYQVERLKALIRRCETLSRLLAGYEHDTQVIQEFFALLVRENIRARKPGKLLKDNLVLVCQKIVETNAETGEHYITRDRGEYFDILKKSGGGGAVTGLTTMIKFLLYHLSTPPLISGLLAVTNYSASFVGLQFLGFTLATKQPAMTATALAATIDESGESIGPMVEEVTHLIRSQIAAVIGNLSTVVPTVILIHLICSNWGAHLTDVEHAHHAIQSFSIVGMTPFYAAFTGVLLWLSSVFAGLFANWVSFRQLPEAIEHHSRLRFVIGEKRARGFSLFLKNNAAAFAANISLAFLLGLTPIIAQFMGLPLDVRHVTLSSGTLTASAMAIGSSVFASLDFWLAVIGIMSMAILNLAVSFALALTVAIWAKKASAPKREVIYQAILENFIREPWVFLFPSKRPN